MKPRQYVKKYNLTESSRFNRDEFVEDMGGDSDAFIALKSAYDVLKSSI